MDEIRKDGIEICEDLCPCGAKIRLHAYTFGRQKGNPQQKFYIDCEAGCGCVSDWKSTPDEAIAAFDAEFGGKTIVSNPS